MSCGVHLGADAEVHSSFFRGRIITFTRDIGRNSYWEIARFLEPMVPVLELKTIQRDENDWAIPRMNECAHLVASWA